MRTIIHCACVFCLVVLLIAAGRWSDMSVAQQNVAFWATYCLAVNTYVLRIFDWAESKEKKK